MARNRGRSNGAGGRGGSLLDTGLHPVFSDKTTSPKFNPLTGPLDSTHLREVRPAIQLVGITSAFKARIAYRMSDDGITWSATITAPSATYQTANGWTFSEGAIVSLTTDLKLYVQIGVEVANVSGTQVEQGLAQVQFEVRPMYGLSVRANQQKVWSDGSMTAIFDALTEPIMVEQIGEYRATLELIANSGDVQVQPAYQVSNDRRTWYNGEGGAAGTFTTFGTNRTSNGITYGTTFSSFAPTERKRFVRFGTATKNGTAGKPETGMVNLRVDARRS